MKQIAVIFISVFLFCACEKVQKVEDFPKHNSKLVVNCIFKSDTLMEFFFSRSLSPIDNAPFKNLISTAAYLVVHEDGILFDTFKHSVTASSKTGYRSVLKKKTVAGKNYSFKSYYPGYETCSGTERMPGPPNVTNFYASYNVTYSYSYINGRDSMWIANAMEKLKFRLEDDPQQKDYYILNIHRSVSNGTDINTYSESEINGQNDVEFLNSRIFVTEIENSNQLGELFFNNEISMHANSPNPDINYTIEVYRCGENAFKYLKTMDQQIINQDDPFSEPSPIWNNIVNGYGIFGGYNFKRLDF